MRQVTESLALSTRLVIYFLCVPASVVQILLLFLKKYDKIFAQVWNQINNGKIRWTKNVLITTSYILFKKRKLVWLKS